jgi:hypothetical protein
MSVTRRIQEDVESTCSASSLAAGEPLAGSATRVDRWLLVEVRSAWGRDVDDTQLPETVRQLTDDFDGRVQLIRRPDRRSGPTLAFAVEAREQEASIRRFRDSGSGFEDDGEVEGPLLAVCCHGRRDRCCARHGPPVYDALGAAFAPESLWQSSHLGGHRFAANVLVLPAGVLLGRVSPAGAAAVAAEVAQERISLDHYRGRTFHSAELQAADAAIRAAFGLTGFADVRISAGDDGRMLVHTPAGDVEAAVVAEAGPPVIESCGKPPAGSIRYSVRW